MEHKVCKQIINAEETLHGGYHTQHLIKETLSFKKTENKFGELNVWKKSEKVLQEAGLAEDQGDVKNWGRSLDYGWGWKRGQLIPLGAI